MVEHIIQAVPGDVGEGVIKAHLNNKALSHNLIGELLRTDPTLVDVGAFRALLRGGVKEFASGEVLQQVRSLGGQFAGAMLTTVLGSETLVGQRNRQVIKFRTDWHWKKEERARLTVEPSIASQVVYLPNLVEGSLRSTYNQTEEGKRLCVAEILISLPKVAGLKWIVGNTPTILRVLANHLKETGKYLLPRVYTWTTDSYQYPEYGFSRLVAGCLVAGGVDVSRLKPDDWDGIVGVFVLGIPEDIGS